MPSREELNERDADFACRLEQRDETVLRDIDQAYAGKARWLLRRNLGSAVDDHAIEEMLDEALMALWRHFKLGPRHTVRKYYFSVVERQLKDHLRRRYREQRRIEQDLPALARSRVSGHPTSEDVLTASENERTKSAIMDLIIEATAQLTDRQLKALCRRFSPSDSDQWAKQLELETRIPAQRWRKASDEAISRVRKYLRDHGVPFSEEGGCYEVA